MPVRKGLVRELTMLRIQKTIFLNKFLQSFHLSATDAVKIEAKTNLAVDPIGKNKTKICAGIVSDIKPLTR